MGKIMLCQGDYGTYEIVQIKKDGKSILIQTDWDYPSIASNFGHSARNRYCKHSGTDGTIMCPDCGKTASYFIGKAQEYLDNHIGKVVYDPGYFD